MRRLRAPAGDIGLALIWSDVAFENVAVEKRDGRGLSHGDEATWLRRTVEEALRANCERVAVVMGMEADPLLDVLADLELELLLEEDVGSIRSAVQWADALDLAALVIALPHHPAAQYPAWKSADIDRIVNSHRLGKQIIPSLGAGRVRAPFLLTREVFPKLLAFGTRANFDRLFSASLLESSPSEASQDPVLEMSERGLRAPLGTGLSRVLGFDFNIGRGRGASVVR